MESHDKVIIASICDTKQSGDCKEVKLTFSEVPYQQLSDIDYSLFAQYWVVAFTSVVALYLFAHCISLIIKLIRNA